MRVKKVSSEKIMGSGKYVEIGKFCLSPIKNRVQELKKRSLRIQIGGGRRLIITRRGTQRKGETGIHS